MSEANPPFETMRRAMVASQLRTTAVSDVRVLEAMGTIAREDFVPEARRAVAYADMAVPLAPGRALNRPMVTALLFDRAAIRPGDRVLVIGAATGYAIAIATRLARSVVAVEEDGALAALAHTALPGATIVQGPFAAGAPDHATFDAIVIDGAVETLPDALIAQLASGGRLATGIVENGITRLALGRRGGAGFGLVSFADAESVILAGFSQPKTFTFESSFAS